MRCFMSDILSLGLVGSLPSIRDVQLCFPRGCAHSGGGQAEKEVVGQVWILLIPEYYEYYDLPNWYCSSGWSESRSRKWGRWSTDREELIKFVASIHFCFCPFYPTCCKVLLVGLYKDQGSPLKMLRSPRMVVQDVMPIIWQKITYNWQVLCLIRHAKTRTLCSYICANFFKPVLIILGILRLILICKFLCYFSLAKNALVLSSIW